MRTFETGATRDGDTDKLDFEGFLSPIVLQRYAEYMHKHRVQPDGSLRDSDNWQKHFGDRHYEVCMKSLWRHFMDLWCGHRNMPARDPIGTALMAILFNVMAYADKYFKDQLNESG